MHLRFLSVLYGSNQMLPTNPYQLFKLDAIGAIVTAFMLGVVLVKFQSFFGVPIEVLRILSIIPCLYFLYSFFCFWQKSQDWRPYLKGIAFANLAYCLLTLALMIFNSESFTLFGYLYFIGEIIIIVVLSRHELSVASS